ncbi:MAG: ABC transporter ATP-binding protein [Planctomycetaceae bacterium]
MTFAIRTENISKCFRIRHVEQSDSSRMLREELMRLLTRPWRRNDPSEQLRRFEDFWAVKDVSVEIQPGEMVGLIGRNGAGKSTFLKILSRVTRPTKGTARIRGRVGSLLEVGTGFHSELTGRENILLSGSILGMTRKEIRRKFDEIVSFAEVERFIDTPVKRYSSGMLVRLGFAVASNLNPEVLIVDEVLAVGDLGFIKKSSEKMGEVCADGRTVLLVTHNLPIIQALTKRCLVMKNGEIVGDGATSDVVKEYRGQWLEGAAATDIPTRYGIEISTPKVLVENIQFLDENGVPVIAAESSKPLQLSFDLIAEKNFPDVVVNVCLCRERVVISGSSSLSMLKGFSLVEGRRVNVRVHYETLPLNGGKYTVLIFAMPSMFSTPKACLSNYHAKVLVVEGTRPTAEGYAILPQTWTAQPAMAVEERFGA